MLRKGIPYNSVSFVEIIVNWVSMKIKMVTAIV